MDSHSPAFSTMGSDSGVLSILVPIALLCVGIVLIKRFESSLQSAQPQTMITSLVNLSLVQYERSFTEEEMALLLNGVVARVMEDKWEVEFQHIDEPHVLFLRSWSRNQVFAVMPVNQDKRTCTELWVNSDYFAAVVLA